MLSTADIPSTSWLHDTVAVITLFAGCVGVSVAACLALLAERNRSLSRRIATLETQCSTEIAKLTLIADIFGRFAGKSAAHSEFQNGLIHEIMKERTFDDQRIRLVAKELKNGEQEIERNELEVEAVLATDSATKQSVLSQLSQAVGDVSTLDLLRELRKIKREDAALLDQAIATLEERLNSSIRYVKETGFREH